MDGFAADVQEDFRQMLLATSHDIKKHLRRKRLYIALLLSAALPILFGLIPELVGSGYPKNPEDYIKNTLGYVTLLVVIIVAFFSGDTISGEFETRTCYSIFATPQRRHSIFFGKHLSSLIIAMSMISLFYLVIYGEVVAVYGFEGATVEFFISYLIALLYTAGAMGLAVFFSSIMNSGMQSTLVTFFMLFLVFDIVSFVLMVAKVDPSFLITYNAGLITNVYGAAPLEIPDFLTFTIPEYKKGVWVMTAYAIILPIIGVFTATRREVK